MFVLDIDGEKDQSLWDKENLTLEEQKAFMTHASDRFPHGKLEQPTP